MEYAEEGRMDPRELDALKRQKMRAERQQSGQTLAARQERLAGDLSKLGVLIEQLEQVLQPVLRDPEPTQALHATPAGFGTVSPLGTFLDGAAGHASELADRVAELMARVDL
jgi:hypothetical protein